jgi:hypothetical protein
VIAALWQVTDIATEPLMAEFYKNLDEGASPESALRNAKLALLHGNRLHNPFYWAPLQLYTQGRSHGYRYPEPATTRRAGTIKPLLLPSVNQ